MHPKKDLFHYNSSKSLSISYTKSLFPNSVLITPEVPSPVYSVRPYLFKLQLRQFMTKVYTLITLSMLQSSRQQVNPCNLRFSLAPYVEVYHKRFAGITGESRMCRHKEIGLEAVYMRSDAVSLHRHTKHTYDRNWARLTPRHAR